MTGMFAKPEAAEARFLRAHRAARRRRPGTAAAGGRNGRATPLARRSSGPEGGPPAIPSPGVHAAARRDGLPDPVAAGRRTSREGLMGAALLNLEGTPGAVFPRRRPLDRSAGTIPRPRGRLGWKARPGSMKGTSLAPKAPRMRSFVAQAMYPPSGAGPVPLRPRGRSGMELPMMHACPSPEVPRMPYLCAAGHGPARWGRPPAPVASGSRIGREGLAGSIPPARERGRVLSSRAGVHASAGPGGSLAPMAIGDRIGSERPMGGTSPAPGRFEALSSRARAPGSPGRGSPLVPASGTRKARRPR